MKRFVGRAIAGLALDPDLMRRTGTVVVAAAYAQEHDIVDTDGKRPKALTIQDV